MSKTRAKHEATVYPRATKYLIAFIGVERWNEENLSVLTTKNLNISAVKIRQTCRTIGHFLWMSDKKS